MRFSERIGKREPRTQLQIDSMDDVLKIGLWNIINTYINEPFLRKYGDRSLRYADEYYYIYCRIWSDFLKMPTDGLFMYSGFRIVEELKNKYNNFEYLDIYDLIEYLVSDPFVTSGHQHFKNEINIVLKKELSGYRFADKLLVPITNENELSEIESVIDATSSDQLKGANIHIKEALSKLSDRKNPDYRNSIKESISAVESLCKVITGDSNSELGKALTEIKKKIPIHAALIEGFKKIYGYTSDGDGIRHSLLEESTLDQEDALFMLISCSAFINYLLVKCDKAGLKFS